jgi:hypothetical protein
MNHQTEGMHTQKQDVKQDIIEVYVLSVWNSGNKVLTRTLSKMTLHSVQEPELSTEYASVEDENQMQVLKNIFLSVPQFHGSLKCIHLTAWGSLSG